MKKRRFAAALLALLLLLLPLSACGGEDAAPRAEELTASVTAQELDTAEPTAEQSAAIMEFGLSLLREGFSDGNSLISPVSLLLALGMTANGAEGQTRAQMEAVLGMDADALSACMHGYLASLPAQNSSTSMGKLNAANSIWVREGVSVREPFLQAAVDAYDAQVYSAPFDRSTVGAVNAWVSRHTDGMIDRILSDLPDNSAMLLLNAVAFEAEWQNIYQVASVRDRTFTCEDGAERTVSMMYSEESRYLESPLASGFLRPYLGGRYVFAALLPDEGVTVSELLSSLDGQALCDLLSAPEDAEVDAGLPKFSYETAMDAKAPLAALGMTDAFSANDADFSGISRAGDLFISRVLHKAYIAVNEKGTRAGAATAVDMGDLGTPLPEEHKTVILDRPFVYLILDTKYTTPVFLGVLMDPGE